MEKQNGLPSYQDFHCWQSRLLATHHLPESFGAMNFPSPTPSPLPATIPLVAMATVAIPATYRRSEPEVSAARAQATTEMANSMLSAPSSGFIGQSPIAVRR